MQTTLQTPGTLVLLALLGGCFQAQLNGPVSGDQAVEFFRVNAASSLGTAQGYVARYLRWPGQATAYMIGMNKFLELRARMQQSPDYDLREFHNLVLTEAALPLSILEQHVDRALAKSE